MKLKDYLKESSLSKLWRHNVKHDCAALTAFRKYSNCGYDENGEQCEDETPILLTKKEKRKRNAALAADLKKKNYNITKVIGSYPEGGYVIKEVSYFVVDSNDKGNIEQDIIELGKKYNQDSVLIIPKGSIDNKNTAYLVGTNKCCNNWLGFNEKQAFQKGKLGYKSPIYTTFVNGRPFIFESYVLTDTLFGSGTNAMLADKWSKEYDGKYNINFNTLSKFMNNATNEQMALYRQYIKEEKPNDLKNLVEKIND